MRVEAGALSGASTSASSTAGPGIPPAERDRVFHRSSGSATIRNATGVGLGLAVAQGFVEAIGGDLESRTRPAAG